MSKRVLVPKGIHPAGPAFLTANGLEIVELTGIEEADLVRDIAGCQGVLARAISYSAAVMDASADLKIIARHGVGVEKVDLAAASARGIAVTNTPLANARAVAEHTMMLILACAKRLMVVNRGLLADNFAVRNGCGAVDLFGKTLGLLGLGRIGSYVAQMASAGFGMDVVFYDPFVAEENIPSGVRRETDRLALIAQSDFLSLHLPVIPQTLHAFGEAEFGAMKQTAYFINCARGELVVMEAMRRALSEGTIAGAGIDVFDPEPPQQEAWLALDNVITTPHSAAETDGAGRLMSLQAAQEIVRVLSGQAPLWQVNQF